MTEYPFIPSFHGIDWEASGEEDRRDRGHIIATDASGYLKRSDPRGKQMPGTMFLGE